MYKKITISVIIVLLTVMLSACSTIPESSLPKEEDTADILLEKARSIYDLDFNNKAIEVYQLIIDKYPEERKIVAWAYYEMAFIMFNMKKWDESLELFYIVVNKYKGDNNSAYILAYEFVKRIEYAYAVNDMEILLHNSSYKVPDTYDPFAEKEKSEKENENEENQNNNNNSDDNDESNEDNSKESDNDDYIEDIDNNN